MPAAVPQGTFRSSCWRYRGSLPFLLHEPSLALPSQAGTATGSSQHSQKVEQPRVLLQQLRTGVPVPPEDGGVDGWTDGHKATSSPSCQLPVAKASPKDNSCCSRCPEHSCAPGWWPGATGARLSCSNWFIHGQTPCRNHYKPELVITWVADSQNRELKPEWQK